MNANEKKMTTGHLKAALAEMAGVCYGEGIGFVEDDPEVKAINLLIEENEKRPEVRWFAGEMEARLRTHDNRPGWLDETFRYLIFRLNQEINELFRCFSHPIAEGEAVPAANKGDIITEAADVANFAMMIADKIRQIQK